MANRYIKAQWWEWFFLLGLDIPIVGVLWAYAFTKSLYVVVSPSKLYQFLFVATWCITIGGRVIRVLLRDPEVDSDRNLNFTKKHCIIFCFLIVLATLTGLWLLLFRLGEIVLAEYALLPSLFSVLFFLCISRSLTYRSSLYKVGNVLLSSLAFGSGIAIPGYLYATMYGVWGYLLAQPVWYLIVLLVLRGVSCEVWRLDEDSPDQGKYSLLLLSGLIVYVGVCLVSSQAQTIYDNATWIYYVLAMSGCFLFVLGRLKKRFSTFNLESLSWVALGIGPLLAILFFL